jgi:predicted nucleic acid-binding protein
MEASNILVDSNVYIDLLRHRRDPAAILHAWAGRRDLAVCGMVRLEVLRGIRSLRLRAALGTFMDVMLNVPADGRLWQEATDLAWALDRQGMIIPGADALIAASALRLNAAVLTSDAHFARIDKLQVIAPPAGWFHS